jgi:hypothetical protein
MFRYIKLIKGEVSYVFSKVINIVAEAISTVTSLATGDISFEKMIHSNTLKFIVAILVIVLIGMI